MHNLNTNNSLALVYQLLRRDIKERYSGSVLGGLWLIIHPLFLFAIYTLVFGEVLQLRFGEAATTTEFAFYLFAGLMVFNALNEVMSHVPTLLIERRDMLLNTPLPAWILPILPVAASVLLEWLSLGVLLLALVFKGQFSFFLVLLYLPFFLVRVLLSLAAAYCLAPLGVFLRDLRQLVPAIMTILLFISPILYPLEVIPERFLSLYELNLIGQLVQGYREALLEGVFSVERFLALVLISGGLFVLSVLWFRSLMPRARYVL